ncbi:MAG TPA: FeoB small GTPase domain-containing protein, partial [Gammaproteobacteria bacterium]|nr:FeoB small GTPase domain-containing protein [Gammaproteobacteria bacterium]
MAAPADAGRGVRGRATQAAVAETAVPLERIAINRKASGTIAVVGNPNAGKSSVFNRLTGLRQHTANYPGVTVERRVGRASFGGVGLDLIDLPGTYSLSPTSTDEQIAVDVLFGRVAGTPRPEAILAVIDSTRLYQGLYLLQQLVELGRPMIVALTMIDAADREGRKIDCAALQEALGGVPVYPVVATSGRGFPALTEALARILTLAPPREAAHWPELKRAAESLVARWRTQGADLHRVEAERLLIDASATPPTAQAGADVTAARAQVFGTEPPLAAEARRRYAWVRATLARVETPGSGVLTQAARLIEWINRPWPATALLFIVMFVMFQAVFAWATPLVDLIDAGFSGLGSLAAAALPDGMLESFVVDGAIAGV